MGQTIKYSKKDGCGHCGCKDFSLIVAADPHSNVKCNRCGAIFYNESLYSDNAGEFTGRYAGTAKEHGYIKNRRRKK